MVLPAAYQKGKTDMCSVQLSVFFIKIHRYDNFTPIYKWDLCV